GTVLYAGTDYDQTALDQLGRLPQDDGSRVYFEADRRGKIAGIEVEAATRLTLTSGKPRNVLGNSDIGIVQLIPRGGDGNWPMISQANVRLGARFHGYDVTLEVFNMFDRRQATTFDEVYTNAPARPVVGGSAEDLVFLKDDFGRPVVVRKGYNLPLTFQAPPSIVLGVHHAF
ncbi:MAG TPA: hypothetical protein VGO00_02360, partial [Kofleriaceae bacterium]|nr:hypothetical protein [Kofleriaceae bacterium]